MTSSTPPPKPPAQAAGIERPDDEVVWVACRAKNKCEGKQARVLFKKNEGMGGTRIQYVCKTCNTPFSIRL